MARCLVGVLPVLHYSTGRTTRRHERTSVPFSTLLIIINTNYMGDNLFIKIEQIANGLSNKLSQIKLIILHVCIVGHQRRTVRYSQARRQYLCKIYQIIISKRVCGGIVVKILPLSDMALRSNSTMQNISYI